jgi:hypothetical protein
MDMLIIAALWCISLLIVHPLGNFPLNDDWSYGLAVKHLVENGDFRPTGWTSMPIITNVLWGALFCLPAGFSFSALQLSTLTLSLLGILGCYLLMRDLSQPRWLAVLTALTLGFNPIYYALSNTFMTDVPYTAMTILPAIFFARSLKTGSDLDLLIATTLAVVATLSRQLALSLPFAFAVCLLLRRGFGIRNLWRAALPSVLCVGALFAFQQWLAVSGRLPALYNFKTEMLVNQLIHPKMFLLTIVENSYVALCYMGLFLLPVLIYAVAGIFRTHKEQTIAMLAFAIVPLVEGSWVRAQLGRSALMPMLPPMGNILIDSGIGPLTLRDTFILKLNHAAALPAGFWIVITVLSILGASFFIATAGVRAINLLQRIGSKVKISDNETVGIFLLLNSMIYLLPLLGTPSTFWDRYLIPILPLSAAGIMGISGQIPRVTSGCTRVLRLAVISLCAASSLFAIAGTRDYLSWNRNRWAALNDLVKNKHVKIEEIDGGFEFNGLYMYDPNYRQEPGKSWWWVHRNTYLIGFQNIPGYSIIKEYGFDHWMPPYAGKVVVLKKNL